MARSGPNANVPLIRLSAFNPFLQELVSRKLDPGKLLVEQGLPPTIPASSELFVSALSMYTLVEQAAAFAGDPYLGATVGGKLDPLAWEPIAAAAESAGTVGELLGRFVVNATDHSSGTVFSVETTGDRAIFGFRRVIEPPFAPAQNDAFYTGFMVNIMKSATGEHWQADRVLVQVSDPAAIPPDYNDLHIARGDYRGFRMHFPADWLFEKFEHPTFAFRINKAVEAHPPGSLIESVRQAILPHIHEEGLTVDRAAQLCGAGKRQLSRKLKDKGTTLAREIAALRRERAAQALVTTNDRVADIAGRVGFIDPTVFSRAFKNWTGQSPQHFRRDHRH